MTDTDDDHLRAPREYGPAGSALWDEITSTLADDGAALDVLERQHADGACRLADRAALLEAALEADPDLVLPGSKNQPVVNPLVTELRLYLAQLAMNLARIKLPSEDADQGQVPRSVHGRAAARKRWAG